MKTNRYVQFVSDEHLLNCVKNLHKAYLKAKSDVTKKKFYKNKIDTVKLTFDSKFNSIDEESLIKAEMLRQIDKSINNSIGTFHEQVLGGVQGFVVGNLSGFDIRAEDNSLFAEIKNKHNTMSSASMESVFTKLARYADDNKNSKCYWVQILAEKSFCKLWTGIINGKERSHSRVFKISGDKFYELLTGQADALFDLYKALPMVAADYLKTIDKIDAVAKNSAVDEIKSETIKTKRSMLDQITFENYSYYLGFEKL